MSDFVSNLIARHTQTEGNVTPRVRGRFESEQGPAGLAPDERNADLYWTDPNPLLSHPNRQLPSFDKQYGKEPKQANRDEYPSVRSVTANPFSRTEPDGPIEPKSQPERADQPTGVLPVYSLFNPVENRPDEALPERVRQGRGESESGDSQRVMPVFKNLNTSENTGFNTRSGGLLGEPNRLPELRQNSPENRAEQAPTSLAQPSIKVTIGRIDVRAMPSPASAPTPAKSAPKPQLSLDDYLKQRNNRPT